MAAPSLPLAQYRTDIQVLRGFAVLLVLFYHARVGLPAGYLGIDVFFVISGFLITRIIKEDIEKGTFRFSNFYFRRAKRLLPASYVAFFGTALLAPFFLTGFEMERFRSQMVGAVTFTANIVLLRQADYFGGAAELKPLLHIWSLALEEQYYMILPAMLVFIPRRFWMRAAIGVFFGSLILCFWRAGKEATFYLLPARAWELTIGSVGTLLLPGDRLVRLFKFAFWPSLVVLVSLPLVQFGYHPGAEALAICLATLVVLMRSHPFLKTGILMRRLANVGNVSYSLYLVHWPLFAFLNNVWIGGPDTRQPISLRIALIGLSLLLAYPLYRYVEVPFRRAEIKSRPGAAGRAIATSLGLVIMTVGLAYAVTRGKDYAFVRRNVIGFGEACNFRSTFEPIAECRNSEKPEMLIWGDSFAMHLVPGILGAKEGAPSIVQATQSVCGPLLGIALVEDKRYDEKWAEECIKFNDSVVAYLKQPGSPKIVVLSSIFSQFVDKSERLLKRDSRTGSDRIVNASLEEALGGLKATVDTVRALGKRVVVVAPPPRVDMDFVRCAERIERKLPVMGVVDQCKISFNAYRKEQADVLELLAALPQFAHVDVIDFDSYLCDAAFCRTFVNDTFIYRDAEHLSYDGSVALANAVSLATKIRERAK